MGFKLRSGNVASFKNMGSSPAKQMTDFSNVTVNREDAETVKKRNIKEREERKKKKEQEMTDLINNPDKNIDIRKMEHHGELKPRKKKSPAKQTKDTFADGSKKSARDKFNDRETALERRKTDREDNQKSQYWYKINGKKTTRAEYIKYQNKPGGDEPGKQTNDPDAMGHKARIAKDRANNKASKRPTVLTEAQTKLLKK